jgi:hypothetical protein
MSKNLNSNLKKLLIILKKENKELHYNLLHQVFENKNLFKKLLILNKDLLSELLHLYHFGYITKKQKVTIINIIKQLISDLNLEKNSNKLYYEINQLINFIEHESEYLNYKPGAKNKEYIKLIDLIQSENQKLNVDKAILEIKGKFIYFDNKIIQGIQLIKGILNTICVINAEHYTSIDNLKEIYKLRILTSSKYRIFNIGNDPYFYLAEPGKLGNQDINNIKKILGADEAKACITLQIVMNTKHIWIRAKRNYPIKFAVEGKNIPFNAPKKQKGFVVRIGNKQTRWAA